MEQYNVWRGYAYEDLYQATQIDKRNSIAFKYACGHLHLAVEKALKALLIYHGVNPPFTHDLIILVSELKNYEVFTDAVNNVSDLMAFAPSSRYPSNDDLDITIDDYNYYLKVATDIVEWVGDRLPVL